MIANNVRELLGEELAAAVETALAGKGKDGGDIVLAVANDGTYVPAEKHDNMKSEAQKAAADMKAAFEKELAKAKTTAALEAALAGHVYDPADVLPLINMDELDLAACGEDGRKAAVDAVLESVKQAKPYLFKPQQNAEKPLALSGAKPAAAGTTQKPAEQAGPSIF